MKFIKRYLARRRLTATMKPNPGLRAKRLAQMHGERKIRYLRNISSISAELWGRP
jgi:hypothetical protein